MNYNLQNLAISCDSTLCEKKLFKWLQRCVVFKIDDREIKRGKLLLIKRNNFHLEITLEEDKKTKCVFDIPIPLFIECHDDENLLYFDYRLKTFLPEMSSLPHFPNTKKPSLYFNKILEISAF